jgi:hypothetical protein
MDWGEDWLQPIQDRLAEQVPQLSKQERDDYDRVCRSAMRLGNSKIACVMPLVIADKSEEAFTEWQGAVSAKYAWISRENLGRLFSQSVYYARK